MTADSDRPAALPAAAVLAGALLVAVATTRDLVHNPTALRVKPVILRPTWHLAVVAVAAAVAWWLLPRRRDRGLVAVGGGAVVAAFVATRAVLRPEPTVAPTPAALLALAGGLVILAVGVASLALVAVGALRERDPSGT